jgi:hypothetical protein
MADLAKGTTFVDGVSIANAANLNNLIDLGTILPGFIADKTNNASPSTGCELVINDAGTLKKVTIANLATVITGGASGVVHGKTAITALTSLDEFLVWEDTAAGERKITYTDLVTALETDLNLSPSDLGLPTVLSGSLTHDPGSVSSFATPTYNVTVTGALTTGNAIANASIDLNVLGMQIVDVRISSANTVAVTYYNYTTNSVNLPSHTIRAMVFQF